MDDSIPSVSDKLDGEAVERVLANGKSAVSSLMNSPERFINREFSWLQFNCRVLEEAANTSHPLLERVFFLSISANNLDEFFMVRVAGLMGQARAGINKLSDDGLTPLEQLVFIKKGIDQLVEGQQKCWATLQEELSKENITIIESSDLILSLIHI